jgi:hypothetical protein
MLKEFCLLGYNVVLSVESQLTVRTTMSLHLQGRRICEGEK